MKQLCTIGMEPCAQQGPERDPHFIFLVIQLSLSVYAGAASPALPCGPVPYGAQRAPSRPRAPHLGGHGLDHDVDVAGDLADVADLEACFGLVAHEHVAEEEAVLVLHEHTTTLQRQQGAA